MVMQEVKKQIQMFIQVVKNQVLAHKEQIIVMLELNIMLIKILMNTDTIGMAFIKKMNFKEKRNYKLEIMLMQKLMVMQRLMLRLV